MGTVQPLALPASCDGLLSAVLVEDGLYFSYSWGSGVHRSHVARLSIENDDIRIIESQAGEFLRCNSWQTLQPVGSVRINGPALAVVDAAGAELRPLFRVIQGS